MSYVSHGTYVASIFKGTGSEAVDTLFPLENTHTSQEDVGCCRGLSQGGALQGRCAGRPDDDDRFEEDCS